MGATKRTPSSWVIIRKSDKEIMCEVFDEKFIKHLNTEKYEARPISDHLHTVNREASRTALSANTPVGTIVYERSQPYLLKQISIYLPKDEKRKPCTRYHLDTLCPECLTKFSIRILHHQKSGWAKRCRNCARPGKKADTTIFECIDWLPLIRR